MNFAYSKDEPFLAYLASKLSLEVEGEKVEIYAGNIEDIRLNLYPYGYDATIHFSGFNEEKLDALFTSPKVMKASLSFNTTGPDKQPGDPIIEFQGLVTKKHFKRIDSEREKTIIGLYEIQFSDNANVTWNEHFPINIHVDQSMKDIIDENKNPHISLTYDWNEIEKTHPIIAYSLEHRGWLPEKAQISFYSFLTWYLHREGGILEYDYKKHTYSIVGKKSDSGEDPIKVYEWNIHTPICTFPSPLRYNNKTLKHTPDNLDAEDKTQDTAFPSVRRDAFDSTSYHAFPEVAKEPSQSTLVPEKNIVHFSIKQFTKDLSLDCLLPGSLIAFKGDKTTGGTWSKDIAYKDHIFRVRNLVFEASRITISEEVKKPLQEYQLHIQVSVEDKEETHVLRPPFKPPLFPFSIQGKVFCNIGEEEQSTYEIAQDDQNPNGQYLVLVPLVGKDKKVVVPFSPDFMTGQHYFPFCKGEKVLLSMYFHTAKIKRIIEWQPLACLPSGVQANQTVLASNGKDQYTIIKHEYEEGKTPVFTIKQSSSDTETQTIQIKEKDITIKVVDQGEKTILINLNGDEGLTLNLQDENSQITQTIQCNGKIMQCTCKGTAGTSTYTQKPDSITIQCKNFTVEADEMLFDAQEKIAQKAQNTVDIKALLANVNASSVKLGG